MGVGDYPYPHFYEDDMDNQEQIDAMVRVLTALGADEFPPLDDVRWLVTEFTECAQMLQDAIDSATTHCTMLSNLVEAVTSEDVKGTVAAVKAALDYHAPDEANQYTGPAHGGLLN